MSTVEENNEKNKLNFSSTITLRTSNRFKKINKNKEETNITEIFNKEVGDTKDIPFVDDLNQTLTNFSNLNINNSSPISLYSESVKSIDEEIPKLLKVKNHVLDTGLKSGHSSPISKLFYKIWKSSSSNNSKSNSNSSFNSKNINSSLSTSSSSLLLLSSSSSSPYVNNEMIEKINGLIHKIETIDNLKPNYFTGCLIIHCKMLKKLFNESCKTKIIKKKGSNKTYIQHWKVAISSIELLIDGLNDGLILIRENQNKNEEEKDDRDENNKISNEEEKHDCKIQKDNEIPDKYKISIRKELYNYQDKDNKEDNELDLFLTELNNKLRKVNQMQIL